MNKYQKYLLKEMEFELTASNGEKGSVKSVDDTLELIENENYTLNDYNLKFLNCVPIKVEIDGNCLLPHDVNISFENQSKFLTLYFDNDIVEPITLKLIYIRSNKETYDLKMKEIREKEFIKIASIKCSTGPSLVNIYFQPCHETYFYTVINLYTAKGTYAPIIGQCITFYKPSLTGGKIEQMIGTYKVEEGALFKSITGLANGVYGYTVSQYDKNGILLFETEPQYFLLN